MRITLTPEEVVAGDQAAEYAERNWKWYLGWGIFSVLFGFVVLSFRIETIWALAIFTGIYFVLLGVAEIIGTWGAQSWKWLYLVAGLAAVGVGIVSFVWPEVTLFVIAILIGWVLLMWGIADIVTSLMHREVHYWWMLLVRGGISIVLGVWALAQPKATLVVFVTIIGLFAIMFGVIEMFAAFEMKHARRRWDALKREGVA